MFFGLRHLRTKNLGLLVSLIFLFFFAVPLVRAADDSNDLDQYKLRVDAFWFYSSPSGNFQGSGENDIIDIQKDLGFNSYSSGFVYADWKFTRKNHFTFAVSPFQQSRTAVLNRTITFQGQTYQVGATVHADLKANMYAPAISTTSFAGVAVIWAWPFSSIYSTPMLPCRRRRRRLAEGR